MDGTVFFRLPSKPPPLWFVTNGQHTVGPVRTDLLLRGILHRRIPDDCLVRELRWSHWRKLDEIREIRTLWTAQALGDPEPVATARRLLPNADRWLAGASDPSEVLLFALQAAVTLTGATAGICTRERGGRAVVSYARGADALLGTELEGDDPVVALAHAGHGTIGEPGAGPVEATIFDRLSIAALGGVAMVPIRHRHGLVAVIELGRADHPFRERDAAVLEALAQSTVARIVRMPPVDAR
jgi:hypothetical protein